MARHRWTAVLAIALFSCSGSTPSRGATSPTAPTVPPSACWSTDPLTTLRTFVRLGESNSALTTTCLHPDADRLRIALPSPGGEGLLIEQAGPIVPPPVWSLPATHEGADTVTYLIPFPDIPRQCGAVTVPCGPPHVAEMYVTLALTEDGTYAVLATLMSASS